MSALTGLGGTDGKRAAALLLPGYIWLTIAVFLPLSAMVYFSFLSETPFGSDTWYFTTENYLEFFQKGFYAKLFFRSLGLAATVTFFCILVGFPCAFVLAKVIKGRWREAMFLLVILPFWSNSLVRVFSWAIVLRGNGVIDATLDAILPFEVSVNLMFSYSAIVIGLVHSYLPYVILTSYLALQAIDDSLIEAARSMGASHLTILWRLILPLSLPGLLAGGSARFCAGDRLVHGTENSRREKRNLFRHRDRGPICSGLQLAVGRGIVIHSTCGGSSNIRIGHPDITEVRLMSKDRILSRIGRFYLVLVLLFLYVPIVVMALMSVNSSEFYQLPIQFSTIWYARLSQNGGNYSSRVYKPLDRLCDDRHRHGSRHRGVASLFQIQLPSKNVATSAFVSANRDPVADNRHVDADIFFYNWNRSWRFCGHTRACCLGNSVCNCRRFRAPSNF